MALVMLQWKLETSTDAEGCADTSDVSAFAGAVAIATENKSLDGAPGVADEKPCSWS